MSHGVVAKGGINLEKPEFRAGRGKERQLRSLLAC